MVINNILAFVLHIIYIFTSFIFTLWFVSTGPKLGRYTTSIIFRIFFIIIFIMIYIYLGSFLSIKKDKKYDFISGTVIALIGIFLWGYTLLYTGGNLWYISEEQREYWILFNIYFCPLTISYFFLDITTTPLILFFTTMIPSLFLGCGIRLKRLMKKELLKTK